jgi:hypothetical protein
MLERACERFADDESVQVLKHDLREQLGISGPWTRLSHSSRSTIWRMGASALYDEVCDLLELGGAFLNFERVASPTLALRRCFLLTMSRDPDADASSDRPLDAGTQLGWLREIGFHDVDCHWEWLELALLGGTEPDG